jgi:hypothetical protein
VNLTKGIKEEADVFLRDFDEATDAGDVDHD